jgi:hypothetical protein
MRIVRPTNSFPASRPAPSQPLLPVWIKRRRQPLKMASQMSHRPGRLTANLRHHNRIHISYGMTNFRLNDFNRGLN